MMKRTCTNFMFMSMGIRFNHILSFADRSENDEETLSETKIRLDDDDEGYDDDGQGIFDEMLCFNLIFI